MFLQITRLIVINKPKYQRSSYYTFFDVIEGWFTKNWWVLSKIKNIIVNLESYSEVWSEVKEALLVLNIQVKDESESTAAKWDHTSCLVVGLRGIWVEVRFIVNELNIVIFEETLAVFEISFGLY